MLLDLEGPQEGADPYDEGLFLHLEEVDGLVHALVDLHGQLVSDFVRQLVNEDHHRLRLPLVLVLDDAHQPVVEVWLQLVLTVDLVKDAQLLLEFRLVMIMVLDNG